MKTVLFLCTGNYFRSRYAEILFNALATKAGLNWRARSRGLLISDRNPGPISRQTLDRLQAQGIPLDGATRYPLPLTDADLAAADLIVALKESEHRPLLREFFPGWVDRVEYWAIHDLDVATADVTLAELEAQVRALMERLADASMLAAEGRVGDES